MKCPSKQQISDMVCNQQPNSDKGWGDGYWKTRGFFARILKDRHGTRKFKLRGGVK